MAGFIVRAVTKKGEDALRQCLQEEKEVLQKKTLRERAIINKLWIRKTTEKPLTDSWQVHPDAIRILRLDKNFNVRAIAEGAEFAMISNGAEKDLDFVLEVEDGQGI